MATSFQIAAAKTQAVLSGSLKRSNQRFSQIAAKYRRADDGQEQTPAAPVQPAPAPAPAPATNERDTEWYRVNSYIADILKDLAMTYSKIARLQQDFAGKEQNDLSEISEDILDIGSQMGSFMKAFHEGESPMVQEHVFGGTPTNAPPANAPPPEIPAEFQKPEDEFEAELDLEGDKDLEDFDEKDEDQSQQ